MKKAESCRDVYNIVMDMKDESDELFELLDSIADGIL